MKAALRFGRYEALFRIAAGGMAEVFAARLCGEAGFQKLVAVKRILPALGEDEQFTRMFLEEARVSAQLNSPHIVQTVDMGRDDEGTPYLVQELVVGVDLLEVMVAAYRARRSVPLPIAIELARQSALALNDAHEARAADGRPLDLVHRDVSPHNLLVGADGRIRLTDFGIARVAFDRLVATKAGVLKGKFAYLAPEQASGEGTADRRTDIYGLGIVTWELLAGQRLFLRGTATDTLEAARLAEVPALAEVRPEVPRAVAEVVHRALFIDPAARPSSAREIATALRSAARAEGLEASDVDVADFLAELAPPRLVELQSRMRQWAADPNVETLGDIELPNDDSEADIDTLFEGPGSDLGQPGTDEATTIDQPDSGDVPTLLQRPGGGRRAPRGVHEASTVRLPSEAPTTLDRAQRSLLVPIVMTVLGLAMGLAALWILLGS